MTRILTNTARGPGRSETGFYDPATTGNFLSWGDHGGSEIFLSGSTADFGQTRLSLRDALSRGGCHVIHQVDFPQTSADTVLKLAQLIEPCGVLFYLIGRNPGSIAAQAALSEYLAVADKDGAFLKSLPDLRTELGDFSGITYTQWEVFIALHLGIPVFVYGDDSHADPAHPQRQHLDRLVKARRYPDTFTDDLDLHKMVQADITVHLRHLAPTSSFIIHPSSFILSFQPPHHSALLRPRHRTRQAPHRPPSRRHRLGRAH